MAKQKNAKYFCENCGAEVASKARFCPHCGKFFSAVRCPNCGHTGSVSEFKKGCPVCHFAISDSEMRGEEKPVKSLGNVISKKSRKKAAGGINFAGGGTGALSEDTPLWLLISGLIVLAGLIVMFIYMFK